jgi:hypothetical protein
MFDNGKEAPRELIAFAFVQEEFARSGDIVKGLMPLFAPLLAKKAFHRFDPAEFAKAVETAYDIPMSSLVAESLVPQLANAGLLHNEKENPNFYRVSKFDYSLPAPDESMAMAIEKLLNDFADFSEGSLRRAHISISTAELKDGLLKRLTDLDFLSFLGRPDKNYFKGRKLGLKKDLDNDDSPAIPEQGLDILCADFAIHVSETAPEKFELLSRLGKGALIAGVVLTLQAPSADSDLSAVTVIIDGPLILDFLDLSTPELKVYAADLFELIERAHLKKAVFLHTVAEMAGTIRAPLDAVMRGEQPYGPLGNRIRRSPTDAAYARAMLADLSNQLERLGFAIVDATTYEGTDYQQYCSKEIEDSLRNDLGVNQESFERRQRDAHSTATLLRMRNVVMHPQSLPEAGFVMVTRNSAVANRSRSNLIYRKRIHEIDFPPVLTDRQIAGVLWFAVGGNLGELSRAKLIANCSAALQPRVDIASKLNQILYETDPKKVAVFAALMRDQRAQRCFMHQTLGFPAAITRDNAESLLEQLQLATADKVLREAASREDQLRNSFSAKIETLANAHGEERVRLQTEIMQLSSANSRLSEETERANRAQQAQLDQLSANVDRLHLEKEQDVCRRMQASVAFANAARKRLKILIVILYALLAVLAIQVPSNTGFGVLLAVVVALGGFWFIPKLLFDKPLSVIWAHHFKGHARRSQLQSHLAEFDINPFDGSAAKKVESR